ncbi:MAG: DUF4960 domain-containing protein [Muribaculaceae bacterium]|nr:DUF4960 domain-containing protein [Muribaculaceae bacterium]
MKNISIYLSIIIAALLGCFTASCSDDDTARSLDLDGECRVEAITVSGYEGEIDHTLRSIMVHVPTGTDLSRLTIDAITLSPGAQCDYPQGTVFDASTPRAIHVSNGDVYLEYVLKVAHDNVELLSFTLNGKYEGSIDNQARTVLVFVPLDEDVTAMQASFTATEGAEVTPESGSLLDFSQPVQFTASLRSATAVYTVTVIKDEMSQAPKAFIGNAASAEQLGQEASAAWRWMLANVPNSRYVSIQSLIDGSARLEDYTMVWCHFDWTDWPGTLWDSRDIFNGYWLRGGAILASRDGARYINDVWRIARDQQSPNNMFGGDSYETLQNPLGFGIEGHEDHPLYAGIDTDGDGRILLLDAGCANSNRTLQWGADWEPYGSMQGWEERTGAIALAQDHGKDVNRVTIAEFLPYEALKGYQSGRVVTIGTPAFEWYDPNRAENPYRENIIKLTKNAINYLCQ